MTCAEKWHALIDLVGSCCVLVDGEILAVFSEVAPD
jgi:hypothetical protein